jgi:hypothetical protein
MKKYQRAPLIIILLTVFTVSVFSTDTDNLYKGKLKEWSIVYHGTFIDTVGRDSYRINSPGFNFTARNAWKLPLLSSTTIFAPSFIFNNGEWNSGLSEYYKYRIGIEEILALDFEGRLGQTWRWRAAPGWSINGITMPGNVGYYPFQSLITGPALVLGADRDWEQGLTVRISAAISYYFFDLIHSANKLDSGISCYAGIGIGFKKGAFMGKYKNEK